MKTFSQYFEVKQVQDITVSYEDERGWYYINLEKNGKMIGQLTWTVSGNNLDGYKPEELELYYIWVDSKYRRQNLGEYLLKLFKVKSKQVFPTATQFSSYITWQGVYNLLNKVFGKPFTIIDDENSDELTPDQVKLRKTQPRATNTTLNYNKSIRMHYGL